MTSAVPHSIEAEESVIGGVLVHAKRMVDVSSLIAPDDFYHPALSAIFEAMVDLDAASQPIDALTVADRMRSIGTFDRLNAFSGADYLLDLMAKVISVENLAYHARIIRAKAERRRWVSRLREIAATGLGEASDDEFFGVAEKGMLDLTNNRRTSESAPRQLKPLLHDFSDELAKRYERLQSGAGDIAGMATGYSDIDSALSGMHPGQLIVLAARPSMGKTALALNIADKVASRKVPALYFSLEMSDRELIERVVAGEAGVDTRRLQTAWLESKHWMRITKATSTLSERPLHIEDRATLTVAEIRSVARRWKLAQSAKEALVVVDYLQLVAPMTDRKGGTREQDVSEVSRGLKLLARELACPVVALSQLNRGLESRTDKRPMLSDLRESGAIEQDADVVAFVYRDEVYSKDQCNPEDKNVAEFIIAKNRKGPTSALRLTWRPEYTRFETISHRSD